jgi:hypothetical protein
MDFTVHNAMSRLEKTGGRWQDVLARKCSLSRALGRDSDNQAQTTKDV